MYFFQFSLPLPHEILDFISERVKGFFGNILKSKYKDVVDDLRESNIIGWCLWFKNMWERKAQLEFIIIIAIVTS